MTSYGLLGRVVLGTWLLLTVGPSLVRAAGHRSKGEMFPLSRWAMFDRVDSQVNDYGLRIEAAGSGPRATPVYFENAGLPASSSVTAYHAIQKLGDALAAKRADLPDARALVEAQYLGRPGLGYEVVARRWDPLVRWHGGPFQSERTIGHFVTEQH